jgi:ligand-binding sensor domain-containing protein
MIKKIAPLIIFLFVQTGLAQAQTPFFQNYFLMKKNEPVQVNKIFQGRNGFIWYGTNKGLFRFDGMENKRYALSDSLADENVTALAEDSVGTLWIGHRNGKISLLKNGVITAFQTREGSATQPISDILFDSRGVLWFSTLNDGLYYYVNERLYRLDEQEGMPDLFVYDIQEDYQGNILAGTDGGIAVCSFRDSKPMITTLNHKNGLPDNIVKKILISGDGFIWLATEDAGIIRFDPKAQKFSSLFSAGWNFGSVSDFVSKGSKFWISGSSFGFIVYDHKTKSYKQYDTRSSSQASSIQTLLKDAEGNIWAGSKTGVIRTPGDYLEFIPTGQVSQNTLTVAEDKTGCIWFSNSAGLFKRCVDATGNVSVTNVLQNTQYRNYRVISLYSADEHVWAGLYGEGVLQINISNGKIKLYNKELRNGNVLSITGKDDKIWLATLGGAEQITVSEGKVTFKNHSTESGLSSDFIYQVFIDSKDRVWFATDGKGVDMMDTEGFHHFQQGLASPVVYGIAEDSNRDIWINVQGSGLYKLGGNGFVPMDSITKFRDNNIAAFAADSVGNLVVMNDLGMDLFNIHTGKVRYLGEEAGIRDMQANLNSLTRDSEGRFLIGTENGIIRIESVGSAIQYSPKIAIESIQVFGTGTPLYDLQDLSYDQNNLTMNFLGFWYQDPSAVNFLYKVDNYDEDWISTRNNSATYSQLPPGEYTFRVKASETGDFANAREDSIAFSISPPFWRTNFFYIGAAMLLIFLGYSFLMYRERQLIQDRLELEAKVEERTREIQRKTEEIQAQNEEIMAQAEEIKGMNENLEAIVRQRTAELEKKNVALEEYAFINAHKLRSPVASILGLVNLISKTSLDKEAKEINQHLQQSAEELDKVVTSITKAIERGDKMI